jgi:hypothetical protein
MIAGTTAAAPIAASTPTTSSSPMKPPNARKPAKTPPKPSPASIPTSPAITMPIKLAIWPTTLIKTKYRKNWIYSAK